MSSLMDLQMQYYTAGVAGTLPIAAVGNATISGDLTVDTTTLHVDSTNNRVGVGTITPDVALDVVGGISISDGITAPTNVAGKAMIYVDSADGDLKVKFADGVTKVIASDV